jgi:hypothetical protein
MSNEQANQGITLEFAKGKTVRLDPFECLLWLLLMLPVGVMIREAFSPDYTFEKAMGRVGAIAALGWGIRKAPTENIFEWLASKKLDKQ